MGGGIWHEWAADESGDWDGVWITLGAGYAVEVEAAGFEGLGTVAEISPAADAGSRTFLVKLGSFVTPLIVMAAIPFSLIGILPAHGAIGAFFTATSMIGFMAGGGIVVRNSIILVDFIQLRLKQGMPLIEAVVDAGAVRFRPMALTAMAV